MWQEAAFFRAVAHYDTSGLHACFSNSPENLQKNNDTRELAFKRTTPRFSRYFPNDTPAGPSALAPAGKDISVPG
jgi:hypothetical protein